MALERASSVSVGSCEGEHALRQSRSPLRALSGIFEQRYAFAVVWQALALAAAQAVEHYEISRYGTLKTWANELGLSDAVRLLDQTLAEEKNTDATLSEIAERTVNQEAEAA